MMRDDIKRYVARRFAAQSNLKRFTPNPRQLFFFAKIIKLARRHGVEIITVINPINHRLYKTFDQSLYSDWRNKIVNLAGSAWDFSGLNAVTTQDQNYYEISHFTRMVGDLVLQNIFNAIKPTPTNPPNFGVLWTVQPDGMIRPQNGTVRANRLDPVRGVFSDERQRVSSARFVLEK